MLPEVIDVPPKFRVCALASEHRVPRLLARSITPCPVGFVSRHAVRCLGQNTCAVSTFAAETAMTIMCRHVLPPQAARRRRRVVHPVNKSSVEVCENRPYFQFSSSSITQLFHICTAVCLLLVSSSSSSSSSSSIFTGILGANPVFLIFGFF